MDLMDLLKILVEKEGSDLYLTTKSPPAIKLHGRLELLDFPPLKKGAAKKIAYSLMDEAMQQKFEQDLEMNFAISESQLGRFRVNVFVQRGEVALVARRINTEIPDFDTLQLPQILKDIIMEKRGLILFVGATGAGKSTSLAALINHRNKNSYDHIITIEDPIEFVHKHEKSIVNQREVGMDTKSYEEALKNTLRQAPDVILIGEIRSRETMESAIAFAETGHLCLSTLHANNANQALDRIINFFPEEKRSQLLLDLSFNLKAIISQRLIPALDNKRIAAIEIMLGTPLICSLIHRGEIESLKSVMESSTNLGMQTFDQALEKLYFEGKITKDEALKNADSKNNLRLRIKLKEEGEEISQRAENLEIEESPGNLSLPPDDDEVISLSLSKD